MKHTYLYLIGLLTLSILISACEQESVIKAPDISNIKVDLEWIRYDKELASINADNPQQSYNKLLTEYPAVTDLYFKRLTNLYTEDQVAFYKRIGEFASDKRISSLADTVAYVFKDTKSIESELTKALGYLKYYFPTFQLPRFYTISSEFSYQSFIFKDQDGRDAVGLGLDLFLGEDFNYKKVDPANPAFSDYLTRTYNKDHLAKKAIEMIVEDLVGNANGKRFLDIMLQQGKKQYVIERLLPHVADTVRWEYTPAQLAWVKENELQMWDFFLDQNLIYETSHLKTAHFLQPAPNSKGMPEQAPGRTGNYIGYKIVSAFMKRNPETSLTELIDFKNGQELLEAARYKPKRK